MQRKSPFRALSPKRSRIGPARDSTGAPPEHVEGTSASGSPIQSRQSSRTQRFSRRRTRRTLPTELPELDQSDEAFQRDWGITRKKEEELLVEYRNRIEAAIGHPLQPIFDKYYLRRFLRARQHDLHKALDMFLAHLKWRAEYQVDTILEDFDFHERDAFLTLYPQGYHKTDKLGRPVYIQHLGQINVKALMEITTEERMLKFHVQEYERCVKYIFPACSKVAGRYIGQTFAIMDVKGVGLKHLTGEVKRILGKITRIDQDNYPETLGKTVIINAPTVFKMVWAIVKPMLDPRTQAKIEVAPSDFMRVLQKWVDIDCIPEYLGGTSKGSLIDDVGPWKDPVILAEVEADIHRRDHGVSTSGGEELLSEGSGPPSPSVITMKQPQVLAPARLPSGARDGGDLSGGSPTSTATPLAAGAAAGAHLVGTSDSDLEEFMDARSRRTSLISSTGSTYMSAEESEVEGGWQSPGEELASTAGAGSNTSDQLLLGNPGPAPRGSPVPPRTALQAVPEDVTPSTKPPPSAGGQRTPPAPLVIPAGSSGSDAGQELSFGDGALSRQTAYATPGSVTGGMVTKPASTLGLPSPPQQISILARVRALEEQLPARERPLRRHLPSGSELPSKTVGQGTLLSRVEALEAAMGALLEAQTAALEEQRRQRERQREEGSSCCACCNIM